MVILYFILTLIGLPFWLWLVMSIWRVSKPGAVLTFFFALPAFYWAYRLWNDKEVNIRTPFIASLVLNLIALPIAIKINSSNIETFLYGAEKMQKKARAAEQAKLNNPEMTRWCKDKNDASYDPVMGTCVEPDKAEVQARNAQENVFGQLEKHLSQSGVKGEFDHGATAAVTQLKSAPEIADVASYHFLPLSMSQPPVLVLLCISESACTRAENQAKERHTDIPQGDSDLLSAEANARSYVTIRNRNLLLFVQPQAMDDARVKALRKAFSGFTPI